MNSPNLERQQIEVVIVAAIRMINLAREPDHQVAESPTAVLYGPGSPLDSLGLVSLLIEVEEGLRDEGAVVSLSDERAVSQKRSPFRDVPSLIQFIENSLSRQPQ